MNSIRYRAAFLAAWAASYCLYAGPALAADGSPVLKTVRPDSELVVVTQGDVSVTLGDVDTWMLDVPEKDRAGFIRSPERIENMLFQLLLMKQVVKEAEATGIAQQPLVKRHMKQASDRTLARYQMEAAREAIAVPDFTDLVAERYAAKPEAYRQPDIATLVHLLITEGERGSDAAVKLINKLYKQAAKNPSKLEELVVKNSDEPNAASTKGLIKDISLSALDADFSEAVRKLKPGELSPPVKSQFGWHIIRLDSIKLGQLPPFEEIKDSIKKQLENEYIEKTFKEYVGGLRQRAVEPNAEVMEALPFRYGGDDEPAPAAETDKPEAAESH